MRKNSKGFMLAEVVVSGTIIITSMVILYATFNKLYTMYNERNSYYNIDGMYASKMMADYLINDDFNNKINDIFGNSTNYVVIANGECQLSNKREKNDGTVIEVNASIDQNLCSGLQKAYNVNTMIITEYDKSVLLNEIKKDTRLNKIADGTNLIFNQTFKDYIDFVVNYYNIGDNNVNYNYIILTEIKNGDNYYYSCLGIG